MAYYSYKNNYPVNQLPNRIRMLDGTTRTDSSTFTSEQLAEANWLPVDNPPAAEYPNILEWTGAEWAIRPPTDYEISQKWATIQQECVQRLEKTDYKVLKAVETGTPVDATLLQYRQELRDLYNNTNSVDPWNIVWPIISDPEIQGPN